MEHKPWVVNEGGHLDTCMQAVQQEIDSIPALIARFDLRSRCTFANSRLADWIERPLASLVGRHIGSIIGRRAWHLHKDQVIAALQGLSSDFNLHVQRRHRTDRWLQVFLSPEYDKRGNICGYHVLAVDISQQARKSQGLQQISQRTSSATGQHYFDALAREVAKELKLKYVFIAECSPDRQEISTRVFFGDGRLLASANSPVAGTPCELILEGETCCYPSHLPERFPLHPAFLSRDVQCFCGAPLKTADDQVVGVLGVMDSLPFDDPGMISSAMDYFAPRVSAEWARISATETLALESKRFRQLLERLPRIAARSFNRNHQITFWNKACEQLYGYTAAEAIGCKIEDLIVPERLRPDAGDMISGWLQATTDIPSSEFTLKDKYGQPVPVYSTHVVLKSGRDDAEIFGLDVELGSLKHAERALRQSEIQQQRLIDILEATPDIVISTDAAQRLLYWNRGARNQLNLPPLTDAEPIYLADIYTPECYAGLMAQVLPIASQVGTWSGEGSLQGAQGLDLFVWQTLVVHRNEQGDIAYLSFIMKDITRYKAQQAQLTHDQKIKVLGQLTSNIAHDFGNLLTIMKGNIELLADILEPQLDAESKELLADSLSAAEDGTRMTRQLRLLSRKKPLAPKAEQANELIERFQRLLSRSLGSTIELKLNLQPGLPSILIDHSQLESALLNLALNAKDAMPQGGVLSLSTELVQVSRHSGSKYEALVPGEYVRITVSDTGHGMDEEVLRNACKPFFTTKTDGRGTGLGLSLIFGLMQELGGLLLLDSAPGAGTRIELMFPTHQTLAATQAKALDQVSNTLQKSLPYRVLAVDDDPAVLRYAVATMKRAGLVITEANCAADALELLKQQPDAFDLLFTDIIMPGEMNGVELAQTVERLYPKIKIALTTAAEPERLTKAANLFPLLKKPYSPNELIQLVCGLCE